MKPYYRIQVALREGLTDRRGEALLQGIRKLGVDGVTGARYTDLYFLRGDHLSAEDVHRLCATLLCDPVIEVAATVFVDGRLRNADWRTAPQCAIEVGLLPGVTDPVAEEIRRAARLLGVESLEQVATGQQVTLFGGCDEATLHVIARRLLCNDAIQYYTIDEPLVPSFTSTMLSTGPDTARGSGRVERIPLRGLDEEALVALSRKRGLSLNAAEMRAIQRYFAQEGRDPTDVELETLAQTWSEHCVHKTFKAIIEYHEEPSPRPSPLIIDGLLDSFIRRATQEAARPWVRSAFVDNAGLIRFDDGFDLAFKVETHNHPSALEPFGGANTGVGGVVRDILGVSARPIAVTDVLCFGQQDMEFAALPEGVLHPRRIAAGVVEGIEDYGNKLGLPTVSGAILYDDGYLANPLVYCGCLGLLPQGRHVRDPRPGDRIVVIGGRTGRDGLHGATFSSASLAHDTGAVAGTVVQIGDPITEKQVMEVVVEARDRGLYHAITDCGAGGLSSAVGEMGADLGADVELARVALKYPGLRPWEIWLSEAQERMVLSVPAENVAALQTICDRHRVLLTDIGAFTDTGRLVVRYQGRVVADLAMEFLHHGLPRRRLRAIWAPPDLSEPELPPMDPARMLLRLLAHPTIASKEDVVRRYDHEVRGGTVVKPLVGAVSDGPSDAVVLCPLVGERVSASDSGVQNPKSETCPEPSRRVPNPKSQRGVALSLGINPLIGRVDPYAMAWAAVDEAVRNAVAVGADPERIALLDNFCWGNPEKPDRLGGLVRAAMGCYDAARAFDLPFVSGKDSLNNEYVAPDGTTLPVPGTLLISAVGIVPDIRRCITMDVKSPGNFLYIVGLTRRELGGSHYLHLSGHQGGTPPAPADQGLAIARALHGAIRDGLVRACHDLSEGGLAVGVAEMAIAGRLGLHIDLRELPRTSDVDRDDIALFAESLSRYLVEVAPGDAVAFEVHFAGLPVARIGTVTTDDHVTVVGLAGEVAVRLTVESLRAAWHSISDCGPFGRVPWQAREGAQGGLRIAKLAPNPKSETCPEPSRRVRNPKSARPPIAILHAPGTNRDAEAALACELAGGAPEIVHVAQLRNGERRLQDYRMLVLPGGFTYGDALGAGRLLALELWVWLAETLAEFVASGKPVLGICNGFQALIKSDVLGPKSEVLSPASKSELSETRPRTPDCTLTHNASGRFECRWVYLRSNPDSPCMFTRGLDELIYCPVAHGEGSFVVRDPATLAALRSRGQIALTYVHPDGRPADGGYPANPNGSVADIAGICNARGNVLGLMPHPEDHVLWYQHPRWTRGERGGLGLRLLENGVRYAAEVRG